MVRHPSRAPDADVGLTGRSCSTQTQMPRGPCQFKYTLSYVKFENHLKLGLFTDIHIVLAYTRAHSCLFLTFSKYIYD